MRVGIAACSAKTKPPEPAVSRRRGVEGGDAAGQAARASHAGEEQAAPRAAGGEVIPLAIGMCRVQHLLSKIIL